MTGVVAVVPNMMDRSRFPSEVRFVADTASAADAALIIVDLDRTDDFERFAALPATTIGYGSHVDTDRFEKARAAGFSEVMARSVFFRRIVEIIDRTRSDT